MIIGLYVCKVSIADIRAERIEMKNHYLETVDKRLQSWKQLLVTMPEGDDREELKGQIRRIEERIEVFSRDLLEDFPKGTAP